MKTEFIHNLHLTTAILVLDDVPNSLLVPIGRICVLKPYKSITSYNFKELKKITACTELYVTGEQCKTEKEKLLYNI